MSTSERDPIGVGVALLGGVLGGLALAAPMLPRSLPVGDSAIVLSPVGAYLLASVVAVVAIPVGIAILYLLSVEIEG